MHQRSVAALRAPNWPIEYGWGMMRFELSQPLAGGRRVPGPLGHTGGSGSWLWYAPTLGVLMAGTVDQTTAAAVPFRDIGRVWQACHGTLDDDHLGLPEKAPDPGRHT